MKKVTIFAITLSYLCLFMFGCNSKDSEKISDSSKQQIIEETETMSNLSTDNVKTSKPNVSNYQNTLDTGIKNINGSKSDFDKLDKDTQYVLINYLTGFYEATLEAIENNDIVSNYKGENVKYFENNFSEIIDNCDYNSDKINVINDFYYLSYVCATYELEKIEFSMRVSQDFNDFENTVIIDDNYCDYLEDLTYIMTNLFNEYVS